MKQKMNTRGMHWCFLLIWMLASSGLHAQQKSKANTDAKGESLDLVFRQLPVQDFNGSAYSLSGDEIRNLPVTNLTNVLAGLVPGFFSRQSERGMGSGGASYWIRGLRTYSEGVLVLVDGQERAFGTLSPHEISSITVLKDAAATVLYGMRGANGAILVNTIKGKAGKPSVELTAQLINQHPVNLLKPLTALDYAENYNKALRNDGMDETNMYDDWYLLQYRKGINSEIYPDVNWMDEYYKKSTWLQRYNLNISGGSNRTRYFVNGGFLTQEGMFNTDDEFSYKTNNDVSRYNIRSNIEVDVTPTTMLSLDLYGWYEKQNRPGGDSYAAYEALAVTPPNAFPPFYTDLGNYLDQSGNTVVGVNGKIVAGDGIHTNPWALLNRNGYAVFENMYGSFRACLTQDLSVVAKGLKASAIFSMDSETQASADRGKAYAYYQLTDPMNPLVLKKTGTDGKMSNSVENKNSNRKANLDLRLSYDRQFSKHGISALIFYNQYETTSDVSIPERFQGGGAWLNYNFDGRYSLDLMTGIQGCYKFAKGDRFGVFPTVAAGWTLSNEAFWKEIKTFIPYLKLKGSYGRLGSHRGVEEYRYMGRLAATSGIYNFGNAMGNVNGYIEDIIAYPGLRWEKSEQTNLGVETKLFKNHLSLTAEYFRDNRSDMYVANQRISSMLGIPIGVSENIGEMYAQGWEFSAMWSGKMNAVRYMLGGTWSYSENEVTALGEIDQPYPWLQSVGYARGLKRGYIAEGLFQSYEEIAAAPRQTFSEVHPGDIRYKDLNGDGIIDSNDQAPIGYSDVPEIVYGMRLGLSYKKFSLSALFQGVANVSRMIDGRCAFPFYAKGNMYRHQLDYWSPENPSGTLPAISTINSGGVNNTQNSSFWISNADYIRLSTLELAYDISMKSAKKLIKGVRVFVNGYNLYTWTKYDSPLDPDAAADGTGMPVNRNFSVGCSIKF
ncbi:MAG: SusC/RagA family TonB-linked outer membrane protein [Mangrovibacterium sp.]